LGALAGQGGFTEKSLGGVLNFLHIKADDNDSRIAAMRTLLAGTEMGEEGCAELRQVLDAARAMGTPESILQIDTTIVRGLDYYTGTVFETFLDDLPGFGSVMSGGRYDGLIGLFAGEDVPAVGISVGIDRLISALEELKRLPATRASAQVLVTVFDEAGTEYALRAATALRNAGVNTELWLEPGSKLQKQMKYADRKGIPCVAVAGPDERAADEATLKIMATGAQQRVKLVGLPGVVQAALAP
jgi:histidyl-tRNA synthetase